MAKLLHVTPRTLHNWISGRYDIPYAAFKLLRVLLRYELPHPNWQGWHFHGGKLYTPEGYSIAAHESSWWSLLLRKAEMFSGLYAQVCELQGRLRDGGTAPRPGMDERDAGQGPGAAQVTPHGAAGRAAQQPGPNLSIGHISTKTGENGLSHREAPRPALTSITLVSTHKWTLPPVPGAMRWMTPERGKEPLSADPLSRASATHPDTAHASHAAPAGLGVPRMSLAGTPPS